MQGIVAGCVGSIPRTAICAATIRGPISAWAQPSAWTVFRFFGRTAAKNPFPAEQRTSSCCSARGKERRRASEWFQKEQEATEKTESHRSSVLSVASCSNKPFANSFQEPDDLLDVGGRGTPIDEAE